MSRLRVLACCVLAALACARDPDTPEGEGQACETDAECNRLRDGGTATCGYLRLCIAGRCESGAADAGSQLVVCRDR